MDFIELYCVCANYEMQKTEIMTAILANLGYESFLEDEKGLFAYIKADEFELKDILYISEKHKNLGFNFSFRRIKDCNWNEEWEKNYFKPIVLGEKLLVRASFHKDIPETEKEIIIDPKTAFGTGHHATTRLILEEIMKTSLKNKIVLDMGTGTGILAIASIMQGAKSVLAVDNDPRAVSNAIENIELNNTKGITVIEGTSDNITEGNYDLIIENIWKNIVIQDFPKLTPFLKANGKMIVSGFYDKDVDEVKKAASDAGLKFMRLREFENWAALVFKKEKV